MIKVDLKSKNKIIISGHANFDEKGKDIVCASVSSIVITTINAILELSPSSIKYVDKPDKIEIEVLDNDLITDKLINNMIILLEELENDYKKNIKIIRR